MEITIKIQAPELAHAIETLAIAIGCTVDKIGIGEAIKEAVDQKPTEKTKETEKVTTEAENDDAIEDKELITLEHVRAAFVAKNSKENAPKLKAILKKYKVAKVTDLPEKHFEAVLKALEEV